MRITTHQRRMSVVATVMMFASITCCLYADYKTGYYDRMDGKRQIELKAAAKECVKNHITLDYYSLPNYWITSDVYPEKYNGQTRWWEMYSNEVYLIRNGQSGVSSFSANKMQREHSVPKSWWKVGNDVEYTPAYSDMWNLYPSDGPANQAKLNYPLGETRTTTFDNGVTKVGSPKTGMGGGCAYVFEPADEYKGDFARAFFYMATVYDELSWKYTYMFRQQKYPTLQTWAVNMLLQWARLDPVSQKEIIRNDAVEKSQGNRNPFIDFPELAEYIWGTRTSETFLISEQGGNVTPPITGDAEITMPVNGESLDFSATAIGISTTSWLRIKGKNLRSPLSVTIGGTNRDYFKSSVSQISPSLINSAEYYDFPIIYTPLSSGRHEARLVLYDGGMEDGKSIIVNLIGEGVDVPELTRLTALPATDVTPTSYTANWEAASEVVDYYIVTRTRFLEDDEETEEVQSPTNSITFTDRNPSVAETYSVRSWRLGMISSPSNTITVEASDSNVDINLSRYDASHFLLTSPDGIMAAGEAPVQNVKIYDMSGRMLREEKMIGGDMIQLDKGIYMIISDLSLRPMKVAICQ